MFNIDNKSLEELSFRFNERDLANFRATLEYLKFRNLLTITQEEFQKAIEGIEKIGELKLNGQIYAFHVSDAFSEMQGGESEGVELYLRQGGTLNNHYQSAGRDYVPSVKSCSKFLKKRGKSKIYTGPLQFDSDFLGLTHETDPEDPITRKILDEEEIKKFKSEGIEVIVLDHLI